MNLTRARLLLPSLSSLLALAACQDGAGGSTPAADAAAGAAPDGGSPVPAVCRPRTPDAYPGGAFAANAADDLALRARFTAFLKPMRDAAADLALVPRAADLEALFEAGTPSLRSLTSAYYAPKIETWLAAFEAAAGKTWMPAEPPPATGGKFGADIYTRDGVDIRQAIEKGMFGATFYNQALALMKGPVSAATVDRLVALYGAHPSFPMNDNAMMTDNPDVWAAQYAKRRTKKDAPAPGLYLQIKGDLVAAHAAAEGGAACEAVLRASLKSFREGWERVLFATVIYYANDAKVKLTKDNATAAEISGGLHSVGEALSFTHGFRMMPAGDRIVTDAQIDEILALLGAPAIGAATVYKFATDAAGEAPKLDRVVDKVKGIYGFSSEQVELYKTNF
jgi:hypothetical protein